MLLQNRLILKIYLLSKFYIKIYIKNFYIYIYVWKSGAPLTETVAIEGEGWGKGGQPCLCLTPERFLGTWGPQDLEEHWRPGGHTLNDLARQTGVLMIRPGFPSRCISLRFADTLHSRYSTHTLQFPQVPTALCGIPGSCCSIHLEPFTLSLHLMTSSLNSSSTFPGKLPQILQETLLTLGSFCFLHYGMC